MAPQNPHKLVACQLHMYAQQMQAMTSLSSRDTGVWHLRKCSCIGSLDTFLLERLVH